MLSHAIIPCDAKLAAESIAIVDNSSKQETHLTMSQNSDPEPLDAVSADKDAERRRPGRHLEILSIELIPLLRGSASVEEIIADLVITPKEALGPARGVMIALFLVAPFWAVLGYYLF